MLKIYHIQEKQEFLKEVATLTQKEWGQKNLTEKEFNKKIKFFKLSFNFLVKKRLVIFQTNLFYTLLL